MGQAFDHGEHLLGEVRGDSFKDVLEQLQRAHPHADKVTIGHLQPGETPPAQQQMPRYHCHKDVWALKIAGIDAPNRLIVPEDEGYAPFRVTQAYLDKHQPEVGGYYVVYDDGYLSFSPAKAFEAGYTPYLRER